MQVTKDVVRDLLPIYLSGDASWDTKVLVEKWLGEDAELRALMEAAKADALPPVASPDGMETRSLQRTWQLLERKSLWLGMALVFTLIPLGVRPDWLADLVLLTGFGGWAAFLITCRRISALGLEAPRRWRVRFFWAGFGSIPGLIAAQLVEQQTGFSRGTFVFFPLLTFAVAMWFGERLRQVATPEELSQPTTLFNK